MSLTRDRTRATADHNRSADASGQSGVWNRLAELAEGIAVPADTNARAAAIHAFERAGWDLIATHTFNGALTHSEACGTFDHFVRLLDSTPWADLPAALRRMGLRRVAPPLPVRIREYLDEHTTRRITLGGVARALGASVSQITRGFRASYRVTVRGYVVRRRVIHAVQLLVDTDTKIQAIAGAVGFESATTLHRQVRRLLNTTPGSIRERRDRAAADRLLDVHEAERASVQGD